MIFKNKVLKETHRTTKHTILKYNLHACKLGLTFLHACDILLIILLAGGVL